MEFSEAASGTTADVGHWVFMHDDAHRGRTDQELSAGHSLVQSGPLLIEIFKDSSGCGRDFWGAQWNGNPSVHLYFSRVHVTHWEWLVYIMEE